MENIYFLRIRIYLRWIQNDDVVFMRIYRYSNRFKPINVCNPAGQSGVTGFQVTFQLYHFALQTSIL